MKLPQWIAAGMESEKIRFVVAGGWNAFFGWVIFSLSWLSLSATVNLWVISAVAHLIATTQAFLVHRHWVFRQAGQPLIPQFLRFQFAYFILLIIGALVVNALSVQGVNPLLAQLAGMGLLAICGFLLGKSFTFNDRDFSAVAGFQRFLIWLPPRLPVLGFFLLSMVLFESIFGSRFYSNPEHIGHDFALTGLHLLEGRNWISSNGVVAGLFNPPWFTPAWCAGAAFYADPQSAFYSTLQMLAFWVDPFVATHLNTLLFAAVAFWGCYALARIVLGWSTASAMIFATLGMVNTFVPLRSAVGQAGFQPLYVWTLLALALCWPSTDQRKTLQHNLAWPSIGVALCLTVWLQFGFGGMLVPGFLATLLFCCVLAVCGRAQFWMIVARCLIGGVVAMILSASKLYESISLLHNFPRNFYSMPGFAGLQDALASIPMSLLQPSEWTYYFGFNRLIGVQFAVLPHEWAMSFGLGALCACLLFGIYLLDLRRNLKASNDRVSPETSRSPVSASVMRKVSMDASKILALSSAILIMLIPIILLWNQGEIRLLIKQIPILSSTTWPMRWIIVYLPLTQLLLALPVRAVLERLTSRDARWAVAVAAGLIWTGPATESVGYYLDPDFQPYDPRPVVRAFENAWTPIPIESVTVGGTGGSRNDAMLQGASEGLCYNPIYGYRMEAFPQRQRLKSGPALGMDEIGQSLIYNPACLVHPEENNCKPGDGFKLENPDQRNQAELFLSRHSYGWKRPFLGQILAWVSQVSFWILLTLIALRAWGVLLQMWQPLPKSGDTGDKTS